MSPNIYMSRHCKATQQFFPIFFLFFFSWVSSLPAFGLRLDFLPTVRLPDGELRRTGPCPDGAGAGTGRVAGNRIKVIVTANGLIFAARCHIRCLFRARLQAPFGLLLALFIKKLKSTACGYGWAYPLRGVAGVYRNNNYVLDAFGSCAEVYNVAK